MNMLRHPRREAKMLLLRLLWKLSGKKIHVGPNSEISLGAHMSCKEGGEISIGSGCHIHSGARLLTYGGNIKIGNNVSINPFTILYGHGGLIIGNNVAIAAHCVVIPANHRTSLGPIKGSPLTKEGITIGSNVWLGAGVRVVDGVSIADGCILGAGAVVTKSTKENGIYAGVPAKLLRFRQEAGNA